MKDKSDKKLIGFDAYEEGAVIEGLNKIRTEQIVKNECTDFVSDLMLKIIRTPAKKVNNYGVPVIACREAAGRGGAAEQEVFCSVGGETGRLSPRRRDEAR